MTAYYNEIEPFAAEWLRELISKKLIPPGDVDERDIRDVTPAELMGYTQCHFFAGIGGWSRALRLAGWPDDRPVWTGSCPCQSFSSAGRGKGFADERHLWPYWYHLIRECRPGTIFGEQVASKLALSWLDLVFDDLEAAGYAYGAADLCAAGVGAPHIRQRLWFVAHAADSRRSRAEDTGAGRSYEGKGARGLQLERVGPTYILGHASDAGRQGGRGDDGAEQQAAERAGGAVGELADALGAGIGGGDQRGFGAGGGEVGEPEDGAGVADELGDGCEDVGTVADAGCDGLKQCEHAGDLVQQAGQEPEHEPGVVSDGPVGRGADGNFWSSCTWLPCRDGKFRPTKPGLSPLAHGIPGRVGKLRAIGNAIVPQVGAEFVKAFMEVAGIVGMVEKR